MRSFFQGKVLSTAAAVVLAFGLTSPALSQTFTTLHNFTGLSDGGRPGSVLVLDEAGNLYGTTYVGGSGLGGTVFKLVPKGSGWVFNTLYSFGGPDGANPVAGVVVGLGGSLYGTTAAGGMPGCNHGYPFNGCGVVFNLRPQPTPCKAVSCPWNENVLYTFNGDTGGNSPSSGAVVFDTGGNLYGTVRFGNAYDEYWGAAYELTPSSGGWIETTIYNFLWNDGVDPVGGVILDRLGNLYGSSFGGGTAWGTVYELMPGSSGWSATVLYNFPYTGARAPNGGVTFDQQGNLYGEVEHGGPQDLGGIFQLTPSPSGWTLNLIYAFTIGNDGGWDHGGGPVFDRYGNLYDVTYNDGPYRNGTVFKLTPGSGGWTYSSLHDFTGGLDGSNPDAGLAIDSQGNLYGTTRYGGAYNQGTVFMIKP
jgi:uncharacterized repeat protein (TIGR03803 family)